MIHIVCSVFLMLMSLACAYTQADDPELRRLTPLPDKLVECSGMASLGNGWYVGNNDSGNPVELYVFRLNTDEKPRIVKIKGASNFDWEELASDSTYVYIGDTGNNSGHREDLVVYRVKKRTLLDNDDAMAEKIEFAYPEQQKFSPSNKHNFDCEAMVCIGDSLYLFTKNRGNFRTDAYSIPKIPGKYSAKHIGSFDAGGFITGADYRKLAGKNELALIGYTVKEKGYHPFILFFPDVISTAFFSSNPKRITFKGKLQTETILFYDDHKVYVTNEEEHGDKGFVYQVDLQK